MSDPQRIEDLVNYDMMFGKHANHKPLVPSPRISPELAAKIAAEIASDIMRSGCGTDADHLNLYKDGRYLGGCCKEAVEQAMKKIIERVGNNG